MNLRLFVGNKCTQPEMVSSSVEKELLKSVSFGS
jgi:hypothetical protein